MSSVMPNDASRAAADYRDKKRYFWPLSAVWVLTPVFSVMLAQASGLHLFTWATVILWYLAIPVVDLLLGSDTSNPPEGAIEELEGDRYYRYLTYLTVPLHYVTLLVAAWAVAELGLGWAAYLGLALSVGIVNGLAINTGHELGHKKTRIERNLAKVCLAVVGYGHFLVEHNKGHHRDVATPEDPASARFGESIYRFALREIPGAVARAWRTEKTRLDRLGKSAWSLDNEVLQPMLITLALYAGLIAWFGPVVLPFLAISTFVGWWMLTSANYIEHYGLLRQKQDNGRYERCRPEHSWNSNHVMSNLVLFHLQRHSDHHAYPTRRYQSLRNFEDLPTLPSGYPGMFALALVPPLWRAVMDHRVLDLYGRDISRVNIDPAKRDSLLRHYSDPDEFDTEAPGAAETPK